MQNQHEQLPTFLLTEIHEQRPLAETREVIMIVWQRGVSTISELQHDIRETTIKITRSQRDWRTDKQGAGFNYLLACPVWGSFNVTLKSFFTKNT